jgi:hypothetical protein
MKNSDITLIEIMNHIYTKHPEVMNGVLGKTTLDILRTFPSFSPNNTGDYKGRADFTTQAINNVFPSLNNLVQFLHGELLTLKHVETFPNTLEQKQNALEIKKFFDQYGSDKSTLHKYHHFYGSILTQRDSVENIFEIGLGTNNTDVVGNMGATGTPGASLRAFRDWCPNANIYGADIDDRVLFTEERIKTFFVDQTNQQTFEDIKKQIPNQFDLVIDDGLHSPYANLNSLKFGLELVKVGGWVVIEDISGHALNIWQSVSAVFPKDKYRCHLYHDDVAVIFAVNKIA